MTPEDKEKLDKILDAIEVLATNLQRVVDLVTDAISEAPDVEA